jgi:NTP pyrophosphatase (non-canonical NTP hydrolase)
MLIRGHIRVLSAHPLDAPLAPPHLYCILLHFRLGGLRHIGDGRLVSFLIPQLTPATRALTDRHRHFDGRQFRDERDWAQFHSLKDMAEAICIESAELLEHFLWKRPEQSTDVSLARKDEVADEIADVAIYLFELADNPGIDLLAAMDAKLPKNAEKYPVSKAKGKSTKYTDL